VPGVDLFLRQAVERGASDFHLSPRVRPVFRIDGVMVGIDGSDSAIEADTSAELVREILPERNRKELESRSDTDFAYEVSGLGRFRVNAFHDRHGLGAVFRHLPARIRSFEELGLPEVLETFCHLSKGLVLVTGPTGSGKTTTLAAMVDFINRHRDEHIITIEDPIEYVHLNKRCLVNQREVGGHAESFERALRAALRQDPDIVLIGEMRDLETTETAITTAETGHLVFGTLHTTTAASSIDRMVDQFPATRQAQIRAMLANSLAGVVSQVLLPRRDGPGRAAAMEVLVVNNAVSNLVREGKSHQIPSAVQMGRGLGMQLLNDDMQRLVKAGIVDPEAATRAAVDKADMANKIRAAGHRVA
jgi:twitching motility protein PilT